MNAPPHRTMFPTDVLPHAPPSLLAWSFSLRHSSLQPGRVMAQAKSKKPGILNKKIANCKGVTGTLGCFARSRYDNRTVLLSSWHVLFGNRAPANGAIWLISETDDGPRYSGIGKTLYGKAGMVNFEGESCYIDCAVGSCQHYPKTDHPQILDGISGPFIASPKRQLVREYGIARPGDRVIKTGAATGITSGIVIDIDYSGVARVAGRSHLAARQLLIQSTDDDVAFSAEGDSGAVIINTANKVVGLLWGANCRGDGIACSIGPVLHAMNITLS